MIKRFPDSFYKRMVRSSLSLFLALAMILSFGMTAFTADAAAELNEADGGADGYPRTVTDQAGRAVVIQHKPERLVSGYFISSSALIALGLREKIVGIEAKADKRQIYRLAAPELIGLPNTGTAKDFHLEDCLAMEPDVVILPLRLKDTAETLEKMGLTVLLVNPESQELMEEMVTLLGKAAGTEERADALLAYIEVCRSFLLQKENTFGERPTVYLAGNSSMLSTAGAEMFQSDMIRLAGGSNTAEMFTDSYWVGISYEQLLAWDPDVILLASDAVYTVEEVLSDPNLVGCRAVKKGAVYQMPSEAEAWDSPVPGGILGSVWLASVLHPDAVSAKESESMIGEFYKEFYGFEYCAEKTKNAA